MKNDVFAFIVGGKAGEGVKKAFLYIHRTRHN